MKYNRNFINGFSIKIIFFEYSKALLNTLSAESLYHGYLIDLTCKTSSEPQIGSFINSSLANNENETNNINLNINFSP